MNPKTLRLNPDFPVVPTVGRTLLTDAFGGIYPPAGKVSLLSIHGRDLSMSGCVCHWRNIDGFYGIARGFLVHRESPLYFLPVWIRDGKDNSEVTSALISSCMYVLKNRCLIQPIRNQDNSSVEFISFENCAICRYNQEQEPCIAYFFNVFCFSASINFRPCTTSPFRARTASM